MPTPQQAQVWVIDHYLEDGLDGSELRLEHRPLPELSEGDVLIKTRLLSLDASNLLWLSPKKDYLEQLQIGDPMRGQIIGQIAASKHPDWTVGDHIFSLQTWADYIVANGDDLSNDPISFTLKPHPDIPLDAYVGTLGVTGWSAYVGLHHIGKIESGKRVLISGAAGATGIMAAQIAKATGAKVYGLAGGEKKCQLLVDKLKLDGAIDYKAATDLKSEIEHAIPDGVEIFFDNVGGEILDAVLPTMSIGGCIVASGSVSQYGKGEQYGIKNLPLVTTRRLRMEGFLILDYLNQVPTILQSMERWFLEGKLINQNQLIHGLEHAQSALSMLATGGNTGKLAVYIDGDE